MKSIAPIVVSVALFSGLWHTPVSTTTRWEQRQLEFPKVPAKGQTSQLHPGQLFENRRAALGGIRTHDILQSTRALYQLSYQSNSAGRGSNHNTTQHIGKPQRMYYGTVHPHSVWHALYTWCVCPCGKKLTAHLMYLFAHFLNIYLHTAASKVKVFCMQGRSESVIYRPWQWYTLACHVCTVRVLLIVVGSAQL